MLSLHELTELTRLNTANFCSYFKLVQGGPQFQLLSAVVQLHLELVVLHGHSSGHLVGLVGVLGRFRVQGVRHYIEHRLTKLQFARLQCMLKRFICPI